MFFLAIRIVERLYPGFTNGLPETLKNRINNKVNRINEHAF